MSSQRLERIKAEVGVHSLMTLREKRDVEWLIEEVERLRGELSKRIDPDQARLLKQALARATGCTVEQIECAPMRCVIECDDKPAVDKMEEDDA